MRVTEGHIYAISSVGMPQNHIDEDGRTNDTMVRERADARERCRLLSTTGCASAHEDASILAEQSARLPKTTGGIPEATQLGRLVTESGWYAKEEPDVDKISEGQRA